MGSARRTESGRMVVREGEVAWRGQRIGSGRMVVGKREI